MMKELILVFVGGGLGSCCRFGCSAFLRRWAGACWAGRDAALFPWGTLGVNLAGCLLIGLLYGWAARGRMGSEALLLLVTGFCGGFTTFSTFSSEMFSLLRGGHEGLFVLYAAASFVGGLGAVWLGHRLALMN